MSFVKRRGERFTIVTLRSSRTSAQKAREHEKKDVQRGDENESRVVAFESTPTILIVEFVRDWALAFVLRFFFTCRSVAALAPRWVFCFVHSM